MTGRRTAVYVLSSRSLLSAFVDLLRLILLLRDLCLGSRADFDASRLQLLWHLAHEIDHKQAVFHVCADDLHMVSEIEGSTVSSAGMPWCSNSGCSPFWPVTRSVPAVLDQFDFVRGKAGDGHRDPGTGLRSSSRCCKAASRSGMLWSSRSKRRSKPTVER